MAADAGLKVLRLEEEYCPGKRLALRDGFASRVLGERRRIIVRDTDEQDMIPRLLTDAGVRSVVGVPLLVEGRCIGLPRLAPAGRRPRRTLDRQRAPRRRAGAGVFFVELPAA